MLMAGVMVVGEGRHPNHCRGVGHGDDDDELVRVISNRLKATLSSVLSTARARRRGPGASPRARCRRHRALTRILLQVIIEECCLRLCHGGLRSQNQQLPVGAVARAARAADAMSREDPLDCRGDKRGHLRGLLDELISGEEPAHLPGVPFLPAPGYMLPAAGGPKTSALEVLADRVSTPNRACVIRLADWLPAAVREAFSAPGHTPVAFMAAVPKFMALLVSTSYLRSFLRPKWLT